MAHSDGQKYAQPNFPPDSALSSDSVAMVLPWPSIEAREKELREFAERVELLT